MVEFLLAAALTACAGPMPAPLVVAHRGGMDSGLPENTLPAFEHAAAVGADLIEIDLRTTRDGQLVVLHDPTVNRTTDGRGAVRHLDLAAIRALDAGGGVRIPTLVEALDATRRLGVALLFDLKTDPGLDHDDLVHQVVQRGDGDRVWFGVRSVADRQRLNSLLPAVRVLGFVPDVADIDGFLAAGVDAIRVWPRWLERDPELVPRLHGAGVQVWVTAGAAGDEALRSLHLQRVDAVLTDRPGAAVAVLGCR